MNDHHPNRMTRIAFVIILALMGLGCSQSEPIARSAATTPFITLKERALMRVEDRLDPYVVLHTIQPSPIKR